MSTDEWTVAEAKARFGELIDRAQSGRPQTITQYGRKAVVVVAAKDWKRNTKRIGNLAEFFAASPLPGTDVKIGRLSGRVRKVNL